MTLDEALQALRAVRVAEVKARAEAHCLKLMNNAARQRYEDAEYAIGESERVVNLACLALLKVLDSEVDIKTAGGG